MGQQNIWGEAKTFRVSKNIGGAAKKLGVAEKIWEAIHFKGGKKFLEMAINLGWVAYQIYH